MGANGKSWKIDTKTGDFLKSFPSLKYKTDLVFKQ